MELDSLQLRLSTWKYQWDLIHDPQTMLFAWAQDEEEGALVKESLGNKYAYLFNHIYSNHNNTKSTYLDSISGSSEKTTFTLNIDATDLTSFTKEEKNWIKAWEVRNYDTTKVFTDILESIKKTEGGMKIPKVVAQKCPANSLILILHL